MPHSCWTMKEQNQREDDGKATPNNACNAYQVSHGRVQRKFTLISINRSSILFESSKEEREK